MESCLLSPMQQIFSYDTFKYAGICKAAWQQEMAPQEINGEPYAEVGVGG